MELRLENKGNISVVHLEKINIILGGNKSGKTRKLNKLEEIFKGNSDYALVNGVEVNNGLYNIVHIKDTRDIDAEVQLKAKSSFHTNVIKPLMNNNYESLTQAVNQFTSSVTNILKEDDNLQYDYLLSSNSVTVSSKKLEKLETILFELYTNDKHSMSSKEEFYFYQVLSNIKEGINNIVLIDDIDRYLDSKTILKFIDILNLRKNVTLILTTKNKYLLYDLKQSKYINKEFNLVDLLPIAKNQMFEKYHKLEESNISIDSYILQSESFYSENEYKNYLKSNFLEILEKINI